ncbi:gigaxonin-like [Sinocyclocheilus grahami]|uniref:gigaxonin-like n=1 Tax=Sinocyclocheilus grahami TaxID=75366 RepID=UPI0007ACAA60|nr:PREDICTED: gigaxonin-like [Sinocyclocheilus grahami]
MSDPKRAGADAGSVVSDPQHSQKLLRVLQSFRQEDCFQDAVLVLEGEQIPVQKNILAAASPYIRTKLNYNPPKEDGSVYKIELQGISVTTMRQILEYIFSGEITLSEDTIQDVVQAADLLLLTDLKSLCCQFLESCITAENCIGIRVFSLHYCLHHVYHVATEYLQTHFRDVANTEEFLEQLPDRLCELLSMEKLNVGNEKHVLEAVVRWIAHDIEARRVHMKEVMSAVWVQGLDQSYLQEQMLGDSLMREVIRNCCIESLGGAMQHGEALLAAFKPRGYSECIVTVGGEERTFGAVACGIGQELYVFGGVRNRDADNPESSQMTICKSEFFHDELKRWVLLDDQNLCIQATSSFVYGAVPIGASIYVVGELDTVVFLRFGAVACGIGQELYVFGGVRNRDADNPESSQMTICKSEFFHDELKRWVLLDDQNLCIQATSSFVYGAVPIGASIYVVGELDTGTSFDYVREFRRSTGTWHPTRPLMPSDLSKTSCAALRIANCKLFRLQLHQGQFRIRVQST